MRDKNFDELINLISQLLAIKTEIDESWGYINLKGNYFSDITNEILKLFNYLTTLNKEGSLTVKFGNNSINKDDLDIYIQNKTAFATWEISINKTQLIFLDTGINFHTNFFCDSKSLENWIDTIEPLDNENPFLKYSPLKIVAKDLVDSVSGPILQIVPPNANINIVAKSNLPTSDKIKETVHFLNSAKLNISPLNYLIINGNSKSAIVQKINKLSIISLSACIVNEYYSDDKVVLDGIKRLSIKFRDKTEIFTESLNLKLIKLVTWVYTDRVSTRLKLFNDRFTLEFDETKSLINELDKYSEDALEQAKQRYEFVILERKDKYISELKDLLKDIRAQSDLYSLKIRNVLNNLLRDILAVVLLVGFTILTKFSDNIQLDKGHLLTYVFTGLAIYCIISITLQSIVDFVDVSVSKKEMFYWKNTIKELLPEKEFKQHIEKSLKGRKRSLQIIYPLIIVVYLLTAIACYEFPSIFHKISNNNITNDTILKCKTPADSCSHSR